MEPIQKPGKNEFPTIEELKAIEEFAHLTDDEAREALFVLQQLAKITYDLWLKEKRSENESI